MEVIHCFVTTILKQILYVYSNDSDGPTQPPMNTFKQFLAQQDDNITDEEAIRKYNEYKLDFKKLQIQEFFNEHKEEEWYVLFCRFFLRLYSPKLIKTTKRSIFHFKLFVKI